jgi:hypothetical protein
MKTPPAATALLTPDAHGWRVRLPDGQHQSARTLGEAAALLSPSQAIHLALPCHAALIERLKFPSTDRQELAGMLQLQLEKTLPYPFEDVSSDFDVISQIENESTLVSVATNNAQLDRLCEPLRSRAQLPRKVTVYAMHVAASCPPDQTTLCVWPEDGHLVVAICEGGKLGYAQTLPGMDAATVLAELPAFLLSAEMEGVPTQFAGIRVEQGCAGLRDELANYFSKPVEIISFDAPLPEPATNLIPPAWVEETRRHQRSGALKQRLQAAAAVYLVLIAAAFLYLAWLKSKVRNLDAILAQTDPLVATTEKQQARWQALAPVVDPTRYTVEIMNLLFANRPSSEVKFTLIETGISQWKVEGEAPNVGDSIDFVAKLKKEPGLSAFKIDAPQPNLLPNNTAHFIIYGKL